MRKPMFIKHLRALRASVPPWELWLLIVLLVTVFGVVLSGPSKPFPTLSSASDQMRFQQDPYDIQADTDSSDGNNRLETGR